MRFVQILMIPLPEGSGNYKDLDKTRVKLVPNFTRHHLITHTYFSKDFTYTRALFNLFRNIMNYRNLRKNSLNSIRLHKQKLP